MKRLFFYYLRYPHDIRMKYCGCQNSCGYPRMRGSDTPLVFIIGKEVMIFESWRNLKMNVLLPGYQP